MPTFPIYPSYDPRGFGTDTIYGKDYFVPLSSLTTQGLADSFTQSMTQFLGTFIAVGSSPTHHAADLSSGGTRTIAFWGSGAGQSAGWTVDEDCFIIGVGMAPGTAFAFVPFVFANYFAGTTRAIAGGDIIVVCSSSSSNLSLGVCKYPLLKDQKVYYNVNVANTGCLILLNK